MGSGLESGYVYHANVLTTGVQSHVHSSALSGYLIMLCR